jgi:predicted nucleotide-binding protein
MAYYHVRVTKKSRPDQDALELNLAKGELQRTIVEPFLKGQAFMCGGEPIPTEDVERIQINVTDKPSGQLLPMIRERRKKSRAIALGIPDEWYVTKEGTDVTRQFLKRAPGKAEGTLERTETATGKNIFIVHGRDDNSKLELARMLEGLHLKVVILSEQPEKGRTVIEKLEQETMDIGYAFVILTPDDVGMESVNYDKAKSEKRKLQDVGLRYRARQNVVLELGYFVGKIGRRRVYCLYKGDIERPSDIHGVIFKRFEKSISECYEAIIKELSAVGYDIKI